MTILDKHQRAMQRIAAMSDEGLLNVYKKSLQAMVDLDYEAKAVEYLRQHTGTGSKARVRQANKFLNGYMLAEINSRGLTIS